MAKTDLLKALVVTAEVCGTELSRLAAETMARALAGYPPAAVLGALARCQREVTGRLSLAAIVQRIDDGHPGPEEAWSLCPRDEDQTVVWTAEIAEAFGVAKPLLVEGDNIGARMAFREVYNAALRRTRDAGAAAQWTTSLGWDSAGRAHVLVAAAEAGRLTPGHVRLQLSPHLPGYEDAMRRLCAVEGGKYLPPDPPPVLPHDPEATAEGLQMMRDVLRKVRP